MLFKNLPHTVIRYIKSLTVLLALAVLTVSCKKDTVDATNTKTLQSSINDMASSLNTLQQVKFNEALYILKTFGVEVDGEINELNALGKLINGKKVPEIFALADQVAQSNGIEWSSTGPPSLGEMNIFGNDQAKEYDPNDIKANALSLELLPQGEGEILGPKSIQVTPRLVDSNGSLIDFAGAGLEAVMEVSSGGNRLITSKNLMQDNKFKGFNIRFASLPATKIIDNKIDITVSVKTSKKTYKMTKVGVAVNPKALLMPSGEPTVMSPGDNTDAQPPTDSADPTDPKPTPSASDPKSSVTKFLGSLSSQNFKAAYDISDNPSWGSYETFANPTSGFGGVKTITVKNMSTNSVSASTASVNATYDVTDKEGRTTAVQVTFGLKNVNGEWKISSYKIN